MDRLPESLPTTILPPLTRTFRARVIHSTRRTPALRTSSPVVISRRASLHPRALVLDGEDPAHDLSRLDHLLGAPELRVPQEPGGAVALGDRRDVAADALEARLPQPHVGLPQVHPARPDPALQRLGRDLEGLRLAGHRRDLALGPRSS